MQYNTGFGWAFDPDERPVWWLRAAEQYYSMIVHTQGHNPAKLLFLQRPNEDPEILRFRMQNFEPITVDAISRAKSEILAPIGSSPFSVELDPSIEDYVDLPIFGHTKAYGTGMDYYQWLFNDALSRMFDDANGYMTWLPYGAGLTDPSIPIDCQAYQIYSITIVHQSDDRITFFKPEDRLTLDDGTIGRVYYTIDKTAYYKHSERYLPKDYMTTFDTELIYTHNLGKLPLVLNGGVKSSAIGRYDSRTRKALFGESSYGSWTPFEAGVGEVNSFSLSDVTLPQFIDYYKSYLWGFVPYGNEALKTFDDWKAARLMTSHPIRVEKQMPCVATGCNGGYVWDAEGDKRKCGSCNGTGSVMVRSPYGSYVVAVPDSTTMGNQTLIDDPVSFVSPPVEGLRYMEEAWQSLIKKAEQSVYQLFSDSVQSGEAKKVDREGKYALIKTISDHCFEHLMYNHLMLLTELRNIINPMPPQIVKPQSFMIRDEATLIAELKQLNEADAPIQVKIKAQKDLIKHRYSGLPDADDMLEIVVLFDPLYGQKMADIMSAYNMGAVSSVDVQRHMVADNLMMRLVERNGDRWLTLSDEQQLADMEAEFATIRMVSPTEIIIPTNEA